MKTRMVLAITALSLLLLASCTQVKPTAENSKMTEWVIATNQYVEDGPLANNDQLQPNKTKVIFADGDSVVLDGRYTLALNQWYTFYYYSQAWHLEVP